MSFATFMLCLFLLAALFAVTLYNTWRSLKPISDDMEKIGRECERPMGDKENYSSLSGLDLFSIGGAFFLYSILASWGDDLIEVLILKAPLDRYSWFIYELVLILIMVRYLLGKFVCALEKERDHMIKTYR